MKSVLVAYAPEDSVRAGGIVEALEGLGYAVTVFACAGPEGSARRQRGTVMRQTQCALILWSRHANLELRQAANDARRAGVLALARLDTASAPALLGMNAVSLRPGRYQAKVVRQLVEQTMSSEEARAPQQTTRYAAVLTALAMSLITASAAYAAIPTFAQQVNAWAAQAEAGLHPRN